MPRPLTEDDLLAIEQHASNLSLVQLLEDCRTMLADIRRLHAIQDKIRKLPMSLALQAKMAPCYPQTDRLHEASMAVSEHVVPLLDAFIPDRVPELVAEIRYLRAKIARLEEQKNAQT